MNERTIAARYLGRNPGCTLSRTSNELLRRENGARLEDHLIGASGANTEPQGNRSSLFPDGNVNRSPHLPHVVLTDSSYNFLTNQDTAESPGHIRIHVRNRVQS
jgi:hypothetical protein